MNGPPLMNSRPAGGDREREQTLNSGEILPFFDAIFAVAFTLLATSVPDRLIEGMDDVAGLMLAISAFLLNGITVLLYWFKLRRLLVVARVVHPSQIALILVSLVSIVVLPRLSALAFLYGDGQGNLFAWSASQVANMVFLGSCSCSTASACCLRSACAGTATAGPTPTGSWTRPSRRNGWASGRC